MRLVLILPAANNTTEDDTTEDNTTEDNTTEDDTTEDNTTEDNTTEDNTTEDNTPSIARAAMKPFATDSPRTAAHEDCPSAA